ncbi:MAG TPA: TIGR03620 family F420-dependent LLM class oxidoreductase, partial [Rugosimonospora sp.]|nr:TIGR03620 family F420-dependent LLM class oxidoreductase [Rugosimonospora sp.]
SPPPAAAGTALSATRRLVVATGITNVWRTPAAQAAAETAGLSTRYPGRFVLGIGVGHSQATPEYRRPYAAMVEYLDALDAAAVPAGERVLAALGPRMLRLSTQRAAGAHPYLIPLEHTARARALLGPQALLAPEVNVVLDSDPDTARQAARKHLRYYLTLTNYTGNFRRFGFTDADLAGGGSDRLVDALYLWGGVDRIRARAGEFYRAGADHLAVQVVPTHADEPPAARYRALAAALVQA